MPEASRLPLCDLLQGSRVIAHRGDLEVLVSGVDHDSRRVGQGDLFCAVDGNRVRGLDFAGDAVGRGAVAVVAQGDLPELPVTTAQVEDVRAAMALASSAVMGHPTAEVPTVGITGTNGKTTTTYLVEAALAAQGVTVGVMGTIDSRLGTQSWPSALTTPESPDLHRRAREMVTGGAAALMMEISSHGIELQRARGIRYRVVALTNLSQDHLDFHGTMDAYAATKLRLFTEELAWSASPVAVVNVDDPFGRRVAAAATCEVLRVSAQGRVEADLRVEEAQSTLSGIEARLVAEGRTLEIRCPLVGHHNVENVAVAMGIVSALGLGSIDDAARGIAGLTAVPGRLEPVDDPRGTRVLVDYAHTPDAIANVVRALSELAAGRLIVVFGCGGDRDRRKRPLMGEAAAAGDLVVVTSDNPRTEEPMAIIEMVLPGVTRAGQERIGIESLGRAARGFIVEPDRGRAITAAISAAAPEDVVLIAGKGHEPYQILGERKIHFDDREQAREAIARARKERDSGEVLR